MANISECSKKFKKLCDKSVALTKKEIRAAKSFSKITKDYSTINDHFVETKKNLDSINYVLEKNTQEVQTLQQIHKNLGEELNKVNNDIQAMKEKIAALKKDGSGGSEKQKSLQQELLQLSILKMCTKTHISDKKTPNTIRGFTTDSDHSKVTPFEIDIGRMTESEIQDAIWENCARSSTHMNEWEKLFNS